ncbi:MAG: PepSY domain-containing protein [Gemmatimonadaceae bacterium]|jgi:uncharacterized iron-regulated membrane protein|nr:PepSY domain-containing protein [Gemmatimonadaceae bacterium]
MPTPAAWRQWHRWIGAPAALFLVFASATGVLVAGTEFFGADEAAREANRKLISTVTTASAPASWSAPVTAAFAEAATRAPNAPVDKVTIEFKGVAPVIAIYTGKPTGGEDQKLLFNATTGAYLATESYRDKPLIHRIHSGEFFGDGGLVVSMLWGLALLGLSISGWMIYLRMLRVDRPERTGLKRFFF